MQPGRDPSCDELPVVIAIIKDKFAEKQYSGNFWQMLCSH